MYKVIPLETPNPVTPLGMTSTPDWHVIKVDDDGRVYVRGEDQFITFKEQYLERVTEITSTGGTVTLYGSFVPQGEIWIVTSVLSWDVDSSIDRINIGIWDGSVFYQVCHETPAGPNQAVSFTGQVYLVEGNCVRATFQGTTVDDNLNMHICGYKMTKLT